MCAVISHNRKKFVFPCAEWKPRLPRRHKVKVQPSSSQTRVGAASDFDSDSDSNKAFSVSFEDSHHSSSMPGPTPMGVEEEGMVNSSVLFYLWLLCCSIERISLHSQTKYAPYMISLMHKSRYASYLRTWQSAC